MHKLSTRHWWQPCCGQRGATRIVFLLGLLAVAPDAVLARGCPAPMHIDQSGWSLDVEVTNWNGLRATDVSFFGHEVVRNMSLNQWNTDYGAGGFLNNTGCNAGGGGFQIFPHGDTQVVQVPDGFHVVQDFRMSNWGSNCNYRFEQRYEFYADGRFRVAAGAYGKGCGDTWYKPLIRIDLSIDGASSDNFGYWDGVAWQSPATETYRVPYVESGHGPHSVNEENHAWRAYDSVTGNGYFIEPANGQYPDEGDGDDPILFALRYDASEGEADLSVLGECCLDDHRVGPHAFVDGESIADQDLVLWYVPRMLTDSESPDYNCWTVAGEPNPETYPCWGGPMFHPTFVVFADGFESGTTMHWSSTVP